METEPQEITLTEREQERLDALLRHARLFSYAGFIIACALAVVQTCGGRSSSLPALAQPLTAVTLLIVAALAMAADRLFRLAYPWLEVDPRRLPFAWIIGGRDSSAWLRATLALLIPVALAAWATALSLDSSLAQLTLVVAALLFAISPRVIEHHFDLLQSRAEQTRGEIRFSGWVLTCLALLRSLAFAAAVLLILLSTIPAWTFAVGDVALISILIFIGLLVIHLFGLLLVGPLDRLGAFFQFATEEALHPARKLIGKTVGEALDAYGLEYDVLEMYDKPRGKLLMVHFETRIDAEPVQIRLYLRYNAKRLFSVDRNWHPDAVRAAEVSSVECDYRPAVTS